MDAKWFAKELGIMASKAAVDEALVDSHLKTAGLVALRLWIEWFEKDGDPANKSGDIYCFFCGSQVADEPHAGDCIYIRAKKLTNA
jgi:hypothetical protein